MAVDGVTSYLGLRETTNGIRLLTGLLAGWGLATLILPMVNSQLWVRPGPSRVPEGLREVAVWLALLAAAFVLLAWALPLAGVLYPLLLSAAIVFTFIVVNLVLVCLIPHFERRCHRTRDAWAAVLHAAAFSGAELALAALVRVLVERLAG